MSRRLGVALATLAAGAGLFTAAMLATAAAARPTSGILKVGGTGNLDSVDPAIAYGTTSWMFEYATAAKLYNYSETGNGVLVPEVAKRLTVFRNGRVYQFFLRRGYRFSDGTAVTARSFAYAIQRAQNRRLGSPANDFISDKNGVDIVGVQANGLKLTIRLARPAPELTAILAMPFFQAASSKLPLTQEVVRVNRVGDLPTAGPYAWSFNDPNHQANLVRNRYYRGPRSHHLAGVEFDMRLNVNDCFQRTVSGDLDLGCVPPAEVQNVAAAYGVSRTRRVKTGRFWVKPTSCSNLVLINQIRDLFRDNASLRKAVNWAVDRTAVAGAYPPYGAAPWTHLLAPGVPGSISARRLQPYSVRPNLAKARQLAAGHLRSGHIIVAYQSAGSVGPASAQLLHQALVNLGFDQARIDMRGFAGYNIYTAAGAKGAPFDLVLGVGYCDDSDPAAILGSFIQPAATGQYSTDSAAYRKKLASISRRLKGGARLAALGRLDLEITRKLAPAVELTTATNNAFFSGRVDPRSLVYSPRFGWSFPALKLR